MIKFKAQTNLNTGLLNSEGIFIEYMYAFSMNENEAVTVIRPVDGQKCVSILENQ